MPDPVSGPPEAEPRTVSDYERWFRVLDAQMRVLERERQKLSAIMNHGDAGFVVMDADRRILWANDAVARIVRNAGGRGAVEGRHCREVVCGADEACADCPAVRPFITGAVAHEEIRLPMGDSARHIYATAMPLASPEGRVEQALVMLQDISDLRILRASQEALKASEERFRSIFTHAAAGMAMVAPTGELLEANPALCSLVAYDGPMLSRLGLQDVLHEDDRARLRQAIEDARAGQDDPPELELRCVARHGGTVWVRASVSWIAGVGERPACAVVLMQDITERKHLEQELRQAEKMSAVGLLVSGVAHELNNPLAGVLGYAQLLLHEPAGERTRRALEAIHREAERCKRIVQNLQTFARKHRPRLEPVLINDVLTATLDLRAYQLAVDDIRVITELGDGLPALRGDSHQLQQVILNLIVNAQHAMLSARRGGTLTLRSLRRGASIVVEIQDDGPGIPSTHLGRVFDPFFTTKEVGQGTGLGLSICYGIIKEHEGNIRVLNVPAGGALFTLELPVWKDVAAAARGATLDDRSAAGPSDAAAEGPRAGGGALVLVVDDEPSILDVLTQMLRLDGHDVLAASGARAALDLIEEHRFDVIVSDLKMPGVSGQELYETLLARHPEQARAVVFSTGDMLSPGTRDFLSSAGRPCIPKPFAIDELRDAIRSVLSRRPS
ncbi:MAG: PAS domain-containing hybrid sensor histidine kinase/response regulator [Candidatus Polarisedimenticolia bacterium]